MDHNKFPPGYSVENPSHSPYPPPPPPQPFNPQYIQQTLQDHQQQQQQQQPQQQLLSPPQPPQPQSPPPQLQLAPPPPPYYYFEPGQAPVYYVPQPPPHGTEYPYHGAVAPFDQRCPSYNDLHVYNKPYLNITGAIVMSLVVFFFCGVVFGLVAFVLAMMGRNSAYNGDARSARKRISASYIVSFVGFVVGIVGATTLVIYLIMFTKRRTISLVAHRYQCCY